jgi:Tfp pilus assembly pilus retraction ATPase PilT
MNSKATIRELLGLKDGIPGINDIVIRVPEEISDCLSLIYKNEYPNNKGETEISNDDVKKEMFDYLRNKDIFAQVYKISFFSVSGTTRRYPLKFGSNINNMVIDILLNFYVNYNFNKINKDYEYQTEVTNIPLRIHYDEAVEYSRFAVRIHQRTYPLLENLVLPIGVYELLMSNKLSRGGLGIFIGGPGDGKSTVMGAALVSRLRLFGGPGITAENPRELLISGPHGDSGWCDQYDVKGDQGFIDAGHNASRQFPSQPNKIFLFGEVNTPTSARIAIQLALNGVFVIMTSHGSSVGTGLSRFVDLASSGSDVKVIRKNIASALKFAMHQEMLPIEDAEEGWGSRRYVCGIVHTMGSTSYNAKVRSILAKGDMDDLEKECSNKFLSRLNNAKIGHGAKYPMPVDVASSEDVNGYEYVKHSVRAVAQDSLNKMEKESLSRDILTILEDIQ